jgi:hypothetical protein
MANEITTSISLVLRNGFLRSDFKPAKILTTQTTGAIFDVSPTIATTETTVTITGLTTPKICILQNLNATNYCEVGFATTVYPMRLFPTGTGLPNIITLNTGTTVLYMKANTASVKVRVMVLDA